MPYKDKAKQQEAKRRSYVRNRAKVIESSSQNRRLRRDQLALIAREAKEIPCMDCERSYPYYVMDFDHVNGEKIGIIGHLVNAPVSEQMLRDEIAKCEVVCSNCHRIRTFTRKDNPIVGDGAPLERV